MQRFVLLCVLLMSGTARADEPLGYVRATDEMHYDVGVVMMQGASFGDASADGMGFRITENNGPLARVGFLAFALPFMLLGSFADQDKHVSVSYGHRMGSATVYDADDKPHTVDGEIRTTTVQTSPFSPQEQAANDAFQARSGAGFEAAIGFPKHVELTYLPDRDDGKLRGISGTLFLMAWAIGSHVEIAFGYSGTRLKADVVDADTGMTHVSLFRSRAFPLRLLVSPAPWFAASVEYHPNLLSLYDEGKHTSYGSTLRARAVISIPRFERLYARFGLEKLAVKSSDWSTSLEMGLRF